MFVQRNESGEIVGVYAARQPGYAEEFLDVKSQEISEFYKRLEEG